MKEINVGLIGFGTIGAGVVHIFGENRGLLDARVGAPIRLKRVADLDIDSDRGVAIDRSLLTANVDDVLDDPDISIVVELIGGVEPAKTFMTRALENNKSVVTANKALLAEHGSEVFATADRTGNDIAFEAAVAGGIPILRSVREGLVANHFEHVLAILNGTCNFILTAMDENPGVSFDETLRRAQELGYAEADPAFDVDGIDAAHKLSIMLTLTHGIRVPMERIYVEGIRGIDPFDIEMAQNLALKVKLLAVIVRHADSVEARVHPTMIPRNHALASVDGVFNGVYIRGDQVGELLFSGRGAGREPTASAVVGDIVEIARNRVAGVPGGRVPPLGYPENGISVNGIRDMDDIVTRYYLRIQALDRPGVMSKVAGIMADYNISIHSVIQKGRHHSERVPVVFLTHDAREADMQAAGKRIGELDVVAVPPVIMRIEGEEDA